MITDHLGKEVKLSAKFSYSITEVQEVVKVFLSSVFYRCRTMVGLNSLLVGEKDYRGSVGFGTLARFDSLLV